MGITNGRIWPGGFTWESVLQHVSAMSSLSLMLKGQIMSF